jgi:hypothetical protein
VPSDKRSTEPPSETKEPLGSRRTIRRVQGSDQRAKRVNHWARVERSAERTERAVGHASNDQPNPTFEPSVKRSTEPSCDTKEPLGTRRTICPPQRASRWARAARSTERNERAIGQAVERSSERSEGSIGHASNDAPSATSGPPGETSEPSSRRRTIRRAQRADRHEKRVNHRARVERSDERNKRTAVRNE